MHHINFITPVMAGSLLHHYRQRLRQARSHVECIFIWQQIRLYRKLTKKSYA